MHDSAKVTDQDFGNLVLGDRSAELLTHRCHRHSRQSAGNDRSKIGEVVVNVQGKAMITYPVPDGYAN